MESNNEFTEIDFKNCICCYFDYTINISNLDPLIFYQRKNHMKIF